jgi:flavin-dependent dehydrogenase
VNPLQGEGIAQALDSGRAAAEAILLGVERAADCYRAHLASRYFPYLATTASLQRSLLRRPQFVAALTRTLTTRPVGSSLAGGWAIAWNDLLDGAPPSTARTVAGTAARLGCVATARSADRRWLRAALA